MIPKVEQAKNQIKIKKETINQSQKNNFAERSESEIQIANQIKQKNQIIKQQKMQNKQNIDKPIVRKLTNSSQKNGSSNDNKGFINTIVLSLIVSVILCTLFMVVFRLIYK